jgi:hypothetical protein
MPNEVVENLLNGFILGLRAFAAENAGNLGPLEFQDLVPAIRPGEHASERSFRVLLQREARLPFDKRRYTRLLVHVEEYPRGRFTLRCGSTEAAFPPDADDVARIHSAVIGALISDLEAQTQICP